jgi:hypothetical protein
MKILKHMENPISGKNIVEHLFPQALLLAASICTVLILPGCATYSSGFAKVESATANRDLNGAIKSLDELKLSGADEALHYLNKGTLLRLQENYNESNKYFEHAKNLQEKLAAISATEQLASVSVNDTLKAYEGLPSEQLMIYSFEALNYIQMGEFDSAAVEARQFDIKQGQIAKKNGNAKYLSGAFVRYINSMVYEAVGERDSARIEMNKALEGYKAQNSSFGIPQGVINDLTRLEARKPPASEVVFLLHNGLGPSLTEFTIRVPNPNPQNGSAYLSLAIPKLAKRSVPVSHITLSEGTDSANSEVVADNNDIAEKSLNDRIPAITARAVARMVVKNVAAKTAKDKTKDTGTLGLLMSVAADIGTAVSERADTRTWSLLPGNINMARLTLPAGKHNLIATYYGSNNNLIGTREFKDVIIKNGQKTFISDYYLNQPSPAKAPQ